MPEYFVGIQLLVALRVLNQEQVPIQRVFLYNSTDLHSKPFRKLSCNIREEIRLQTRKKIGQFFGNLTFINV